MWIRRALGNIRRVKFSSSTCACWLCGANQQSFDPWMIRNSNFIAACRRRYRLPSVGAPLLTKQPVVAQPNAQSTHMAFSIMPIAALFNAMKRMAFAQTGWLKSNHQPYH
jgi:hypothetical protein